MGEKSKTVAMIWSFLFTGMGFVYLGNNKKGLGLFAAGVIFNLMGMFILGFFHYFSILTWIISLYLTYKEPVATKSNRSLGNRHINERYVDDFSPIDRRTSQRSYESRPVNRQYSDMHYDDRRADQRIVERPVNERPIDRQVIDNVGEGPISRAYEENEMFTGRRHSDIHYEGLSYDDEMNVRERSVHRQYRDERKLRDEVEDDIMSRRRIRK